MKVSVLLATYNGADYLLEQLESIRNQTVCPDEVIIFDDGSTDDTPDLIRHYIEQHDLSESWHFSVNEHNLGYANNFHALVQESTGDIVFFCDQDDVWELHKIEDCVSTMEGNLHIGLLATEYSELRQAESSPHLSRHVLSHMDASGDLEQISFGKSGLHIWLGCAMAARREFLQRAEKYWFDGWAHDEWVWFIAQALESCWMLHSPLHKRRLHEENLSLKKIHDKTSRLEYLEKLSKAYGAAFRCASESKAAKETVAYLEHCERCSRLRADLLKQFSIGTAMRLLPLLSYYQSKKAYLTELYISARGCR